MGAFSDSEEYVEWIRRRAASRKRLAYFAIVVSLIALAILMIIGKQRCLTLDQGQKMTSETKREIKTTIVFALSVMLIVVASLVLLFCIARV